MKSIIITFAALLFIIATPFVFTAIDNMITQDTSQSIAGVTTGAGEYSENVTLGRAIYNNDTTSITGISSNVSSDTPTASAYNSVAKRLEVSGLNASQVRTLTVAFMIDSTTLPTGAVAFLTLLRWFWIFAVVGMIGGAIYAFFD